MAYFKDVFSTSSIGSSRYEYVDLRAICEQNGVDIGSLPYVLRVLLEGCLRNNGKEGFQKDTANAIMRWSDAQKPDNVAIPFLPARVLMQDFTGVPVLNDLAALRSAMQRDGKNPEIVNPIIPSNLVIDHSVQVLFHAQSDARQINEAKEFEQNFERYAFLKWSQGAFDNLAVLPPGLGICHQVNLEHLAKVAFTKDMPDGSTLVYPDSVLGTDSHTPMINGLGVLGWGVGGIEALASLLGYPTEFPMPEIIAIRLSGSLPATATATDLTLAFTAKMREIGVVGAFLEVIGDGAAKLPVETRAMIANMTPEAGATATYFPVDEQTIDYLLRTGRTQEQAEIIRTYFKASSMFRNGADKPKYSSEINFNLDEVQTVIAGPKRPQDLIQFDNVSQVFNDSLVDEKGIHGYGISESEQNTFVEVDIQGETCSIRHGSVLIAAITSCTNTSDPTVMFAAALLARNAHQAGLRPKPWVKTSFAPGSRVVTEYLTKAGLLEHLEVLGFGVVGYGCTTCIGNSGPINPVLAKAVAENNLIAAGVLSGNRNFEGRIHPATQANFLMSPPLVVAYALAGTVDFDFEQTPLGVSAEGKPIFLKDIYPSMEEQNATTNTYIFKKLYSENYANIYEGNPQWNDMPVSGTSVFEWKNESTMIKEPSFLFEGFGEPGALQGIDGAYALAILGDSVTTDHISPAGRIARDNPAGEYLQAHGVEPAEFISFGARRGNHEVMMRGTFSNPRLRNQMVKGVDGGFTLHIPSGETLTIYEAAVRYKAEGIPLVVIAGEAYGTGSSRDWAAKGTYLLGVQAVIAKSYERIHRTNLACMGILPLQFPAGVDAQSLGLTGSERFTIHGIHAIDTIQPVVDVTITHDDGSKETFSATARIDTPLELAYFKSGGLMRKLREDF